MFTSHHGLYKHLQVQMQEMVWKASSVFQPATDTMTSTLEGKVALEFVKDIAFSVNHSRVIQSKLQTVWNSLSRAGVQVILWNGFFIEDSNDYFGHTKYFPPSTSKKALVTIRRLQHLINVTEHKSFLCLFSVFWRFVQVSVGIADLIHSMLQKDQPLY